MKTPLAITVLALFLSSCDENPARKNDVPATDSQQLPVIVPDTSAVSMPVVPMDTTKSDMPVVKPADSIQAK